MECVNCSEELNDSILTSKARPWYCPACKHPNFLPETPHLQPSAEFMVSCKQIDTIVENIAAMRKYKKRARHPDLAKMTKKECFILGMEGTLEELKLIKL